jgi:hypothetical protein
MAHRANAKAALQRLARRVPNLGKSKSLNILAIAVRARLLRCSRKTSYQREAS